MILDILFELVAGMIDWLVQTVNGLWEGLPGTDSMEAGLAFLGRFDTWLPVTDAMTMLAALLALGTVLWGIKLTMKLVDWIPG